LPDGKIVVDDDHFPTALVKGWKANGKKVLISVGGQNGNWNSIFSSATNIQNFIASVTETVNKHKIDGVDLDIESYMAPPRVVANTIIKLKESLLTLGRKYLVVSP
jgi:GH18 family chitinase